MVRARLARGALGVALVAVAWPAAGAGVGPFEAERAAATARLTALRGRPEAIAPLAELLALEDSLPSAALEAALKEAAGPASHPLVAAQAALQLARLYGDRGDEEKARATRGALGLLTRVQVVGPFGEGRAGHSQVFPPETEIEAPFKGRTYRGKVGQVGWRAADDVVREGAILLDAMLRPDTQSTAYVVAFVRSPREQDVAVRLGAPGPLKVWVDRALVHAGDAVHAAAMDQTAAAAHLRRGWNRILVKTTVTDLPWRLYLRVTDPAGRPLALGDGAPPGPAGTSAPSRPAPFGPSTPSLPPGSLRSASPLASLGLASPKAVAGGVARRASHAVETLEAALRKRAAAAPAGAAGAEAWLDLGRYLAWAEPGDHEARQAAAALETARARQPSVTVLGLLADVARDEDERRRSLEAALALAGSDASTRALLLARLGDAARAQRRDTVALARWREALAADPGCWPAALALADEEQGAGLVRVAVARVQALPAEVLSVARARRQWARLLEAAGRRREAREQLEGLAREHRHDVDLLHDLAMDARARGDGDVLRARLAEAAALRPDLTSLELELARVLEGAGEGARAREVLTALATRLPDDAIVQAQLGKLLHRQGLREEALARLRAATALRPQDPELRRYAERVGREGDGDASEEDLARRYAADGRAIVVAAAGSAGTSAPPRPASFGPSTPSLPPGSLRSASPLASLGLAAARADEPGDATVLLDRRVVRVHKNGLAQTFAQRLVAIRTDHGAEENKEFYVRYTPGSEDVEIRQARVYRRGQGGALEVLEAADRDDQDLSEPWYGLYYDNRAEIVRFEGLRAGDVLEVQYVVEDVSAENQMADYFGDLQTIAETVPKRVWEYTLVAPASRPIYANTPRVARLTSDVSEQGDERVYRFSARDVPAIEAEPAMPGLAEVAPYLHVSTYASWEEVGAWYWRLVEEQLLPDDDLRKAARGAVKAGQSEAERVRAIHALVVTGTRYVGLEFGIHGYKPYKVTQVLARRFGDCKDKASLMVALLREVGVEAELVLVRTRRGGNVEKQPASLAVFDHAIAYVPKLDLYLDGTAEFSGTRELPAQDQGVMVLRVGPKGTRLAETPVLPSTENRVDRKWTVELASDGAATVREDLTIRGQAAADWREHYQTPGERAERYGRVWTGRYPGARLTSIDMPALEDRDAPVTVRAVAEVPRLGVAAGAGGGLTLPLTVREADFSRTYARLSTRKQDLVIAYPWQHDEEIVYRLPAGWAVRGPSPARSVDGPFGNLRVEVTTAAGGEVRVHSFLDVTRARIAPADYPAFRAFLGEIDAAFAERLAVGPEGAGQ